MSRQEIMNIVADAYLIDDLGFGSMDVMEMIGELEESFGCTIDEDNLEQFVQVKDIVEYIEKAC